MVHKLALVALIGILIAGAHGSESKYSTNRGAE